MWGGCLEGVGSQECVWKLSEGHGEAVLRVWGCYLYGVGMLSDGCGDAV